MVTLSTSRPPVAFILDVDGVMTDGKFHYSENGKVMKVFGADDSDAFSLLASSLDIHFVSGDRRGFAISKARIADDMK
jgi:3-deoxy-D-manno-octulosonate 8-phosphate phosphatase (KDO 8-P phosphatase)